MRKGFVIVFLSLFIMASGVTYAADTIPLRSGDFKDIPSNHWAIDAIEWGLNNNITSGYGNGIFAPDRQVTEAEFAAILARFATNLPDTFTPIADKPWSEPYYIELGKYGLPFRGYYSLEVRDKAVTRGTVAQVIAGKYGFNLTMRQAVYFMYENGLSSGKSATEKTYESYGIGDPLTRAQALTFLKNMTNFDTKEMTFLGEKSVNGFSNSTYVSNLSYVSVNTKLEVDFSVFNQNKPPEEILVMDLADITALTTKVVDGKVVAVQGLKIDEPTKIQGVTDPSMNYYIITTGRTPTVSAPRLLNSVVHYKGVDLPFGFNFSTPEGMITFDDKYVGIVQLSLDYVNKTSAGVFTDQAAFIALLPNLKLLGATQGQIDKLIPILKEYQNVHIGKLINTEITSKSKNTSILVTYGKYGVTVGLYSRPLLFDQGRIYVD